jgi:hypothetical protein
MQHKKWGLLILLSSLAWAGLACRVASQAVSDEPTPTREYSGAGPLEPTRTPVPTRRPQSTSNPSSGTLNSSVVDAYLSFDESGQQPSTTFGQGDPVYLYGLLEAPNGANLKTAWIAVNAEGNEPNTLVYQFDEKSYQSGPFYYRLEWPRPWALGQYQAKLYVDGKLDRSLDYEVVETNTSGASIDGLTLTKDQEGKETAQAFGEGDTIYLQFNLANAQPDTPVRVIWIAKNVKGMKPNTYINEYAALMNSGPNWMSIRQAQPWELGEYQADLFVNSQLVQSAAYTIEKTNTTGAQMTNSFTAKDEAGADKTDIFTIDDSIYVHFSLANVPQDAAVIASMAKVDKDGSATFIDKYRDVFTAGDYYVFFAPNGPWEPGQYVVYLYVNGDLAQTLQIQVE